MIIIIHSERMVAEFWKKMLMRERQLSQYQIFATDKMEEFGELLKMNGVAVTICNYSSPSWGPAIIGRAKNIGQNIKCIVAPACPDISQLRTADAIVSTTDSPKGIINNFVSHIPLKT